MKKNYFNLSQIKVFSNFSKLTIALMAEEKRLIKRIHTPTYYLISVCDDSVEIFFFVFRYLQAKKEDKWMMKVIRNKIFVISSEEFPMIMRKVY